MASPDEDVLVYTRRTDGHASSDVSIMKRSELDQLLAKSPALQCATKPIVRGQRHIEILRKDLTPNANDRAANARFPNQAASLASVEVPARAYMQRLTLPRAFAVLFIVSERSNARNTTDGSIGNYQHDSSNDEFEDALSS